MSLFVRVFNNFYTHRKTARLRVALGNDAFWIPPRLWCYAAEHQPDGIFSDYSAAEIAMAVSFTGDAQAMLEALLQAGFMDQNPLKIHDWPDYNGYHALYSNRAKRAAEERWRREREKKALLSTEDRRGEEASNASSIATSIKPHINGDPPKKVKKFASEAFKAMESIKKEIETIQQAGARSQWRDDRGSLSGKAKTRIAELRGLLEQNRIIAYAT